VTKTETNTRDVGLAIRDFLEGFPISRFTEVDGELEEIVEADNIVQIDVSDPHNPVAHMESGAQFTIRIVRTG
jgi:hypothetical protein